MKVSKFSKAYIIERLLLLVLNEVEKQSPSKCRKIIRTMKYTMYAVMALRIAVAVYLKVKSKDE